MNVTRQLGCLTLFGIVTAQCSFAAEPPERTSAVSDRESINLTIYNGSSALVHDRRRVTLAPGVNRIAWRDVSANMDPTSALLDDSGSARRVEVLEQNFNFDLLDPSALLQKYVGRDVIVVHPAAFAGQRETREPARVLTTNGGIVLQYRDRIETSLRGYIAYPVSPEHFRDQPTLDLDLQADGGGLRTLDLSYMTGGLDWHADYVGTLSPDETQLALTGLVTLSNTSGVRYENARLQLVAGNVRLAPAPPLGALVKAGTTSDVYSVGSVKEENYFEYHLYTMPRPTTILDKQTKQLTLLTARDVPARKTLELRGGGEYYENASADLGDRVPVTVYVTFENKGGDLGIPLPGGTIRLYKNDSNGLSQFVGSDQVEHTPKNQPVRLHLGDSFDVTARKRQTSFDHVNGCSVDSSYQIDLSNAKAIVQTVAVVETIPGEWSIVDENVPHRKSSASTATWNVALPADGSSILTYTAHVQWC